MSRCDREGGVSHRVLFITLLAIAVTFTVILTNLFVDIDGLVRSGMSVHKRHKAPVKTEPPVLLEDVTPDPKPPEVFYNDDEDNFDENDDAFRTKRSLESQVHQHHPKNPKMTKLLTHRLASLLEEIDTEDVTTTPTYQAITTEREKETTTNVRLVHGEGDEKDETSLLRLAVHNLLLDGVANHIDFSEIYKEVQAFQKAIKKMYPTKELPARKAPSIKSATIPNVITSTPGPNVALFKKESFDEADDENKILYEELLKCAELRTAIKERSENITDNVKFKMPKATDADESKTGPKFIITTKINIETSDDKNKTSSKNDFTSIVHITHNGKPVSINNDMASYKTTETQSNKENDGNKTFAHNFLREYFKMFYHDIRPNYSEISKIETKRLKRHIKLRFTDQNDSDKGEYDKYDNTIVKRSGSADDELFVEIKTFFNNNTVKGDKKRKLIETLIEKIENAVHSDLPVNDHKQRKKVTSKHWNIKKRSQNPLKQHRFRTQNVPLHITSRQIIAIGKMEQKPRSQEAVEIREPYNNDYYRVKFDDGPYQVNGNYEPKYYEDDKYKNIAQRMQVPLNVNKDVSNETMNDLHKLKFLIKNIDGSGFSIGFNQYSDEPPDPESIKLFTGLDHLIRTYHQQYDQIDEDNGYYENYYDQNHLMAKRNVVFSKFKRFTPSLVDFRKVNTDYTNADGIFGNEIFSLDNYVDKFNDETESNNLGLINETNGTKFNLNSSLNLSNESQEASLKKAHPIITDALSDKQLKLAEILNLAEAFGRKKRSLDVMNLTLKGIILRHRIKHAKGREIKIKRQVPLVHHSEHLDYVDDIFKDPYEQYRRSMFADKDEVTMAPYTRENNAFNKRNPLLPPILYQQNPTFNNYRRTVIVPMTDKASTYPHVFQDSNIRLEQEKEPEYFPLNPNYNIDVLNIKQFDDNKDPIEAENSEVPNFKDIVGGYSDKNYNIRVKVLPKQIRNKDGNTNASETMAGFKEVHTSINKSFNRDGKRISSMLNISEISHVEDLHNSTSNCSAKPSVSKTSSVVSHIVVNQQPQDHMKNILTEHKNMINKILVSLEKEKIKIDNMLSSNVKLGRQQEKEINLKVFNSAADLVGLAKKVGKSDELLDITLPFQPPKVLRLSKEQIGKILGDSLRILDDRKTLHNQKQEDPKGDLLLQNIIKENVDLTHEIMKKIDRNTDKLDQFLQKLSSDKRISSLKRASMGSDEVMKTGGNVVNIIKNKDIKNTEPLRVQMLPLEIKSNEAPITKPIANLQNKEETKNPAVTTAAYNILNKTTA